MPTVPKKGRFQTEMLKEWGKKGEAQCSSSLTEGATHLLRMFKPRYPISGKFTLRNNSSSTSVSPPSVLGCNWQFDSGRRLMHLDFYLHILYPCSIFPSIFFACKNPCRLQFQWSHYFCHVHFAIFQYRFTDQLTRNHVARKVHLNSCFQTTNTKVLAKGS